MPRVPPARLGLWRSWKAKHFRSRILSCHPAIGSVPETGLHPIGNDVDELQSIDLDALTELVAEQQRKLHAKATSEEKNYRALL